MLRLIEEKCESAKKSADGLGETASGLIILLDRKEQVRTTHKQKNERPFDGNNYKVNDNVIYFGKLWALP